MTFQKSAILCSLGIFLAVSVPALAATTIYQHGTFDPAPPANSGNYSDNTMGLFQASQFTLAESVTIDTITIQGYFEGTPPSSVPHFTMAILTGNPNDPSVVGEVVNSPTVGVEMTPLGGGGQNIFVLTPGASIVLSAGTYWLSVAGTGDRGDFGPPANALRWAANGSIYSNPPITSGTPNATAFGNQNGQYFVDTDPTDGPALVQFIYSLQGTVHPVPEPAALALAGLGLTTGLLRRRR